MAKPPRPIATALQADPLRLVIERMEKFLRDARPGEQSCAGDNMLLTLARRIGREYQMRMREMPGVDEPRWMILLEVLVVSSKGEKMPFMSAARAAGVAVSTGQRYVHDLVEKGLLAQFQSDDDQRITHVRLSDRGRESVVRALRNLAARAVETPAQERCVTP